MATPPLRLGGKPITLKAGEQLLWTGQPKQGVLRNPLHIAFGLGALGTGLWLGFGLAGAMAVALGLYLMFGHAIVEKNRRANMYYAITTQRALLAYGLRVLAYPVLPTSEIRLKKGRYDTVFLDVPPLGAHTGPRRIGFGHLENGQEMFDMLTKVKRSANTGAHHTYTRA